MPESDGQGGPAPAEAALRTPGSCAELFWVFHHLALQGFGGVLPVAHRALVERQRWLTPVQFVELLSLAQVLPGPNVINISLIFGDRHFGWRGAVSATAGLLAAPLLIVLTLGLLYRHFATNPLVAGALRGMGAVAAGLVLSTAAKLLPTLRKSPLGLLAASGLASAAFIAIGLLRWPLAGVVLGLGAVGMGLALWRMRAAPGGAT